MAATNPALTANTPVVNDHVKPSRRSRRRHDCIRAVCFFLAVSVAVSAGISVLVHRWLAPVTVSFDLTRTVDQFRDQMAQQISAAHPLTEEQIAQTSRRFQDAMNDSLQEYSRSHHAVILVTPAVVTGAHDITADIQAAIAEKMNGGE